jgi:amino-acid N-acetyltransferase
MLSAITTELEFESPASAVGIRIRKAAMRDIPAILALINGYAAAGIMLARTEFELSENMRDFAVAFVGDQMAGCGALHFYSPVIGEIRSLAVSPYAKTQGIGREIVRFLLTEAKEYYLGAVFAFTYVPGFFSRVGFSEVERGALPLKAWKDCLRCSKFQNCDEIAVLRVLDPALWDPAGLASPEPDLLIQLPTPKKSY